MRIILISIVLSIAILLNGCATIFGQCGDQGIDFTSKPSGAVVTVDDDYRGVTPITVKLNRHREHFATVSSGGQTYNKKIGVGLNLFLFGNILFGGLIGIAVDTLDGAAWSLYPWSINPDFHDRKSIEDSHEDVKPPHDYRNDLDELKR